MYHLLMHLKCAEIDPDFTPTHGHGAFTQTPTPTSAPRPSKAGKRPHRPNH